MGAYIKGTNGRSNGVVPFLKVANDTAVAVNQGGKRKGAVCAYLESWHRDIEEFIDLRKNTGDDRRRTHDMNTANWVPDLFMKRVMEEGQWTLFSPEDAPDLHDLTGAEFEARYAIYEREADEGRITQLQAPAGRAAVAQDAVHAVRDRPPLGDLQGPVQPAQPAAAHRRRAQLQPVHRDHPQHQGRQEIAVCNLGSINLPAHIDDNGELDRPKLEQTINTAMRMLDNVIEYNYYSVPTARNSNLRHRPVGMGVMGFQDALYKLRLPYDSDEAVTFADRSMEAISYYAIKASSDLAEERGKYQSFDGSLWSQGILPIDSIRNLAESRGQYLQQDTSVSGDFDWDTLRERVKTIGMRNSNCMAIAPTATIANITGVSQSIEPTYQNLFVKSNLSGDFTVVNNYLVNDLKARDLWDEVMVHDLKYFDGSVQAIDRIPDELKAIYKCAFEVNPKRLVDAGSRRQKWIDQAQSLNLYMSEPNGRKLDELYKHAWLSGLKTTYYLRTMGATHAEKTTISDGRLNKVAGSGSGGGGVTSTGVNGAGGDASRPPSTPAASTYEPQAPKACAIDDPDCEACQ